MKRIALSTVFALTLLPCLANAGVVPLIDPSFEASANTFPLYVTNPAAVDTGIPGGGWFTDANVTSQCRKQTMGPGTFWGSLTGMAGVKAMDATQFNIQPVSDRGAALYQTVFLDAGNTYTLTIAVGTAKGALLGGDGTSSGVSKCDGKFAIGFTNAPLNLGPTTPVQTGFFAQAATLAEYSGTVGNLLGYLTDYSVNFTPSVSGNYNIMMGDRGYVPGTGLDNQQSTIFFDNVRLTYTPEPSTALLLVFGSIGTMFGRRRTVA